MPPRGVLIATPLRFELDPLDRRGEPDDGRKRKAGDDQVAVAVRHAPIGPCRGRIIGEVIGDGDAFQPGAADEAADRLEVVIPFAAGRQGVGGAVARRRRGRDPLQPGVERRSRGFPLARREAEMPVLDAPSGRLPIDNQAGLLRDPRPRIAIARVQPAATEIEPMAGNLVSPCASPEAARRLQQERRTPARRQLPRSADPRGPAADDHDIELSIHRVSPGRAWRRPRSIERPSLPGAQ